MGGNFMRRIIEILREIKINHHSISLDYLTNKFKLTTRTIQKDIKFINELFSKYSDCKVVFKKNKLHVIGKDDVEKSIKKVLINFSHLHHQNKFVEVYHLILFFIDEENFVSLNKLLTFLKIDQYSLLKNINLINNYFDNHSLNLKLIFKQKNG